jgi:hypothetical protein
VLELQGNWRAETTTATYLRVSTIAAGGMGQVDLAMRREGTFLRLYAIKRLHSHFQGDADIRANFVEEARIAGLLRHPNVVSVLDVGQDSHGPFLVMDYVEGVSVSALIRRSLESGAPIPLGVVLRIAHQAVTGLAAAHELTTPDGEPLHLVHRDISPQNILVGFDGCARVTDFGIAKALGRQSRTSTGILKGKLGYMSPEQLRFRAPDHRSDLFAFGVVLYEMLVGHRLYARGEAEEIASRILEEPPPDVGDERDDAPPELVDLVFRLLAKDPAQRPPDARSVARAIDGLLGDITASGGTADVCEHMIAAFGEERAIERARISEGIARAEREAITTRTRRSPARRVVVATLLAAAVAVAGGTAWINARPDEASGSTPQASLATSVAQSPASALPSAAPAGIGSAASDPATATATATTSTDPRSATAPSRASASSARPAPDHELRDRRARSRPRREPAKRTASEDPLRLWGWQ